MSVCNFNLVPPPGEDLCMQPAAWHVRLEGDEGWVLASCDAHLGNALKPQRLVVDTGDWQETDALAQNFHMYQGACGQDNTWWIEDLDCCLSEPDAVRLGYAEYVD